MVAAGRRRRHPAGYRSAYQGAGDGRDGHHTFSRELSHWPSRNDAGARPAVAAGAARRGAVARPAADLDVASVSQRRVVGGVDAELASAVRCRRFGPAGCWGRCRCR